ncbi:flagellar biosynthetic protein FliO [Clostridium sp. N3C]|uniref:flagellar biosynthetic protein FliO n=1 Tax=Clostridium sp. N3C TaxID=1776758 RepID=UPI00092E119F|nr:flagellar biosynthetic protein FliO [Clostridium sp. N3C]SCN21316.1 flagellar biosynthetic protein FliO [Clostridium sp. N3C]
MKDTLLMFLQILVFLPFVLLLIYLSLKLGGTKFHSLQNNKFIKIYERTAVSKDNSLVIAQIGKKGYVLASCNGKLEVLRELEEEEMKSITMQKSIPKYNNLKDLYKKIGLKRKDT